MDQVTGCQLSMDQVGGCFGRFLQAGVVGIRNAAASGWSFRSINDMVNTSSQLMASPLLSLLYSSSTSGVLKCCFEPPSSARKFSIGKTTHSRFGGTIAWLSLVRLISLNAIANQAAANHLPP